MHIPLMEKEGADKTKMIALILKSSSIIGGNGEDLFNSFFFYCPNISFLSFIVSFALLNSSEEEGPVCGRKSPLMLSPFNFHGLHISLSSFMATHSTITQLFVLLWTVVCGWKTCLLIIQGMPTHNFLKQHSPWELRQAVKEPKEISQKKEVYFV